MGGVDIVVFLRAVTKIGWVHGADEYTKAGQYTNRHDIENGSVQQLSAYGREWTKHVRAVGGADARRLLTMSGAAVHIPR